MWKRYVVDSFCIIKKDEIPAFHNILNSLDPRISFTIEHKNNGQIPFLDPLVSRHNGTIYVDVYWKTTHSHHDIKHKESTTVALLHSFEPP